METPNPIPLPKSKRPPQSRNWCFTLFNISELKPFEELEANYLVYQTERCPDTQKDHIQGYIQLKKPHYLTWVKKLFPTAHWEIRKASHEDARQYCMKDDTRISGPHEFGIHTEKGSNKRKKALMCEEDPESMKVDDPNYYRRWFSQKTEKEFMEGYVFRHSLLPWQLELEIKIKRPPDDRHIIWVYGKNGNEGKSTYAKKLKADGWHYTRGGRTENIFYSYGPNIKNNIVFDIPRSSMDYINYACLEAVKDGLFESTKYEPATFSRLGDVHVVVMANFLPEVNRTKREWNHEQKSYDIILLDNNTLSKDRLDIIDCSRYPVPPIIMPINTYEFKETRIDLSDGKFGTKRYNSDGSIEFTVHLVTGEIKKFILRMKNTSVTSSKNPVTVEAQLSARQKAHQEAHQEAQLEAQLKENLKIAHQECQTSGKKPTCLSPIKKRRNWARRPAVVSAKESRNHYDLWTHCNGDVILKIDKLVYVLIRKPDGRIVSESFTPSEYTMYSNNVMK